ncbi:18757_t:CDS:2, partial [Racocetra persica]
TDPERIKFTEKSKIVMTISILPQEDFDKSKMSSNYGQINKKGTLLIELYDTGIGFSRGDISIARKQEVTRLGLTICKSLVEINGGEINTESQLEEGTFISLYEDNEEEVMKISLKLKVLDINSNRLAIIFIVFLNNEGNSLAKKLIREVGEITSVIYMPITRKKLINQIIYLKKNSAASKNNTNPQINESKYTNIL